MKRYWPTIRHHFVDLLIVLAALDAALEIALRRGEKHAPTFPLWVSVPLVVALILPLLARRQFRFAAPVSIPVALAVVSFFDGYFVTFPTGIFLTVLASSFLLGMLYDRRQGVAGLAILIGAAGIVTNNNPSQHLGDFFGIAVLAAIVWLAGFGLGRKLEQVTEAEERAAQLEREREEKARAAVAEERARIARELHDVVGHAVSVMTVQAAAARRLLLPEQEREREALLVVEQTGREALAEMRKLVGVLRRPEEAPALAPQPSLEHLDKLVENAREAGLPVELRVEGQAAKLPPGVDLTAYRLVQEGLTNAIKHAGASRADVLVRYGDGAVEVVVSDDGTGNGAPDAISGGHGLVGMRERVAVYGGELEAGPKPGGGYALRAKLPLG